METIAVVLIPSLRAVPEYVSAANLRHLIREGVSSS